MRLMAEANRIGWASAEGRCLGRKCGGKRGMAEKREVITRTFEYAALFEPTGWQWINTKLKHNNRNPRELLGVETPHVGSPS